MVSVEEGESVSWVHKGPEKAKPQVAEVRESEIP